MLGATEKLWESQACGAEAQPKHTAIVQYC